MRAFGYTCPYTQTALTAARDTEQNVRQTRAHRLKLLCLETIRNEPYRIVGRGL